MTARGAAIAAVVLRLCRPAPSEGETRPEFLARVSVIGEGVNEAAREVPWRFGRRAMVAAVLVIFEGESRFDLEVHAGRRRGDHGRAICLGSVHASKLAPDWAELGGTDAGATFRCARAVARNLRAKAWECLPKDAIGPGDMMGWIFEGYGRGHCAPPGEQAAARGRAWAALVGDARWRK
jgi:hypothetical protein